MVWRSYTNLNRSPLALIIVNFSCRSDPFSYGDIGWWDISLALLCFVRDFPLVFLTKPLWLVIVRFDFLHLFGNFFFEDYVTAGAKHKLRVFVFTSFWPHIYCWRGPHGHRLSVPSQARQRELPLSWGLNQLPPEASISQKTWASCPLENFTPNTLKGYIEKSYHKESYKIYITLFSFFVLMSVFWAL